MGFVGPFIAHAALSISVNPELAVKPKMWPGTDLVLLTSIVMATIGLAVGWFAPKWRPKLPQIGKFTGDQVFDGVLDGVKALAGWHTRLVVNGNLSAYLGLFFIVICGMLIAGYAIGRPDFTIPAAWPASITSIAGFLLGFIGLVSLVVLRGRVALAMGLGVMGAGVALIFLARGAVDLALTQLTVEAITVLIFVVVFRSLPTLGKPRGGLSGLAVAVISILFGVSATLAVLSVNYQPGIGTMMHEVSYTQGYGRNIVNVILVDIRALDTMGEIVVLALAAMGVCAVFAIKSQYTRRHIAARVAATKEENE